MQQHRTTACAFDGPDGLQTPTGMSAAMHRAVETRPSTDAVGGIGSGSISSRWQYSFTLQSQLFRHEVTLTSQPSYDGGGALLQAPVLSQPADCPAA